MKLNFKFWQKPLSTQPTAKEKPILTYEACKELYTNWALGKRLVKSLPNFALSTKREIIIQDAPSEAVEAFKKACEEHKIDRVVKRLSIINRIYGLAGLVVVTNNPTDDFKPLTSKDIQDYKLKFNILDPINQNVTFSQDSLSFYFQEPSFPYVNGRKVSGKRMYVCTNGEPLFIEFEASALNFAGRSVFKNMQELIDLWETLIVSVKRIAVKSSSILITNQNAIKDPMGVETSKRAVWILEQLQEGGGALLNQGQNAEFFNLNGLQEVVGLIDKVKELIAIALEDTPLPLLMDKSLSNGLSEGSEDMKAVVMAVENFRSEYLSPIYQFLDSFMFHKAWSDSFINETIKPKYGEYADLAPWQIRQYWIENFRFEWNSIYPETPDEKTKKEDGKMNRLLQLQTLGADTNSLQDNLNDANLFPNQVTLSQPPQEPILEEEEL